MKINYKFLEGSFIDRPNRFLTRIKYNGTIVESHLPDPGRLKELLKPGVRILLKKESGEHRKTKFSTQAVYDGNTLISLNTLLPNKFTNYDIVTFFLYTFSGRKSKFACFIYSLALKVFITFKRKSTFLTFLFWFRV